MISFFVLRLQLFESVDRKVRIFFFLLSSSRLPASAGSLCGSLSTCDGVAQIRTSMAAALESRSNERPGRQHHHQQQTHSEEQQRQLRKRKWPSDERAVEEAATEKMLEAADIAFFNTQLEEHKPSLLYSVRTALQHQGLQLKRALRFSLGSSANLMLQGETWRPFFATAVCVHRLYHV